MCIRRRMTLLISTCTFLEVMRFGCVSEPGTLWKSHTMYLSERRGDDEGIYCLQPMIQSHPGIDRPLVVISKNQALPIQLKRSLLAWQAKNNLKKVQ